MDKRCSGLVIYMKNSLIKDKYKRTLFNKFELKRTLARSIIDNCSLSNNQRMRAIEQLSLLPRNSTVTRIKNYCVLTNRSKGVYRCFKLSRIAIRDLASSGVIPGLIKSSW